MTATATRSATRTSTDTSTPTPTATATLSPSVTETATWTATASATATASSNASATASFSTTATGSATLSASPTAIASASPSGTPTAAPSATLAPQPTPRDWPYRFSLAVYNSAGERVRSLGSGVSPDGWVRLDPGLAAVALPGARLLADGAYEWGGPPSWDGKNDGGQGVALGTYYIKLEILDPFGAVTAYSQAVQVASRPSPVLITVFNAAGEAVRRERLDLGPGSWDMDLEQDQVVLQAGPASGKLELKLRGSGEPPRRWAWDGRNDAGALVSPGSYLIQLESGEPESRRLVSKGAVVLAAAPPTALLQGWGQESSGGRLLARGWPGAGAFHLRLYNLSGELVGQAQAADGGTAALDCRALARGVYLLEARTLPSAPYPLRELKKAALWR